MFDFDSDKFEDIPAWQEARGLVKLVYEHTSTGPWALEDVLRHEIRQAAISIVTKIAQGSARQDVLEFRKLVSQARSLTAVVKTHLYLAMDLEFLDQAGFDAVNAAVESTLRMIDFLADGLKRTPRR
jgi:four helix bundle protein